MATSPTQQLHGTNVSSNIGEALEARIKDPLWFLARQWQSGEFEAEDGGRLTYLTIDTAEAPLRSATLGGRTVPAWVNEGLATVLEPKGPEDVEATLARTNVRPGLSKLHRSFVGLSSRDAEIAYASAARAVRRLIEQRGVAALVALLEDLARGAQFASAFQERIAMRYEDFVALVARD